MTIFNSSIQNAIRVNHRGFLRSSKKRFILTDNKTEDLSFRIIITDDVKEITVYEGTMSPVYEDNTTYYLGDFSSVTREGDYYIEAGGYRSRQFVIYDGAYDICQRIMLEYFKYQRCGHPLGWNGSCHLDDGIIKETGERVDLSGGYHQSCELRKSPGGVSIGVLSLLRFALKDKSEWGQILLKDECRWALRYYLKVIQENGAMYNTLNAPLGWDARVFYKSPAPSSSQWNVTSILASGYMFFKESDPVFAEECLKKAIRSYNFMTSDERSSESYVHPEEPPIGMDPSFFFDLCRKGSTADAASMISASADMYRATKDSRYVEIIKDSLPFLLSHITKGFTLLRDDDTEKTVTASCSYGWLMGGLLALCDAYELMPDFNGLREKIIHALDKIRNFADKSVWRSIQIPYCDKDLDVIGDFSNMTRRQGMKNLKEYDGLFYNGDVHYAPVYSPYIGLFIARASALLRMPEYLEYAQSIADTLLGANILDSSHIHGVGFNHCQHKSYGQFFPSTPFIPGAVGVEYSSLDPHSSSSEFDMPCVGLSMYLLSEICLSTVK